MKVAFVGRSWFWPCVAVLVAVGTVLVWQRLRAPADATEADCRVLLDAVVRIELQEQGYRDEVLQRRRQAQLARVFASQLASCVGRPLPPGALACARVATSSEQLSHECLHERWGALETEGPR